MQQLCRVAIVCAVLAAAGPAAANTVTGVTVSPSAADAGAVITATVTGADGYCGAVHIDWGDGTAVTHATEKLPVTYTHTYKAGGTFAVRAQGMGNCSGEATTRVTVKGPAVAARLAALEISPNPATPGSPVRIALNGTGTCRLTLDFGDGNRQQIERGLPATVPHTYAQPGGYTVAAEPDQACGGERRTATVEVAARQAPPRLAGLEVSGGASATERTIRVTGTGTCQFRIDYGDGNSETRARPLPDTLRHNYPAAGRYDIVATAIEPCSGSARSSLTIGGGGGTRPGTAGHISRIDVRPQTARRGDAITIDVLGSGTCRLTLDFDDGTTRAVRTSLPARFSHRFGVPGDYEIVVWPDEPCAGVGEAVVRVR